MPYTTYPAYKEASARHLLACQQMLSQVPSLSGHRQEQLIKSIYYLSGYVLEGSINYAIYNHLRFPSGDTVETLEDKKAGISFFSKKNIPHRIAGHNFQHNLSWVETNMLPSGSAVNVPFFSSSLVAVPPSMRYLFDNWEPHLRYDCPVSISEPDVSSWLTLCARFRTGMFVDILGETP